MDHDKFLTPKQILEWQDEVEKKRKRACERLGEFLRPLRASLVRFAGLTAEKRAILLQLTSKEDNAVADAISRVINSCADEDLAEFLILFTGWLKNNGAYRPGDTQPPQDLPSVP